MQIGDVQLASKVVLAPMAGITDLPLRRQVRRFGPQLVFSEMIASQDLASGGKGMFFRSRLDPDLEPAGVQIAGCEAHWMAEAAKIAEASGASIIDINMGCPAKKVAGGFSGSALMRDLRRAASLLEATVAAVNVPVTLKMRTGWDEDSRNAPELARIAEQIGIQLISVHGRTRNQFYKGKADWHFIRTVKETVKIPVLANGDVLREQDALRALKASNADGIMVGRGVQGRPWFLSQIHSFLEDGGEKSPPNAALQLDVLLDLYQDYLSFYGMEMGVRVARKHIRWFLEAGVSSGMIEGEAGDAVWATVREECEPKVVMSVLSQTYTRRGQGCCVASRAA